MKGVKMVLCNPLGISKRSSLQLVQSGPHSYAVNISKLLLLCIFDPGLCLYNLSNTSKTKSLPYLWLFPWGRWCLTSNSQPKPQWDFPPCRDLSIGKSWACLLPEPLKAMPAHQLQTFRCNSLIPMMLTVYPNCQLLLTATSEHHFPFTELYISPVLRLGCVSYWLLSPCEQVGFKTCLHTCKTCLKCNLPFFGKCFAFSLPFLQFVFYIAIFWS